LSIVRTLLMSAYILSKTTSVTIYTFIHTILVKTYAFVKHTIYEICMRCFDAINKHTKMKTKYAYGGHTFLESKIYKKVCLIRASKNEVNDA